ncbi:hypothetical protein C8J57DRAFT_1526621 [Mycena rebaudengoi]|nr:hypothetical protein C8J57DRAFT_1526621 [Mycena rebaudengoi]
MGGSGSEKNYTNAPRQPVSCDHRCTTVFEVVKWGYGVGEAIGTRQCGGTQNDGTGYYKLWLDGVKVLEKYNIATTIAQTDEFEFRVGLYANGWHDDGGMLGTQPFRQVWYDQIGMGTTFADADPDQWS